MFMKDVPGIQAPFYSDASIEVRMAAAKKAQEHLDYLDKKYGFRKSGKDGRVRFKNGEDVAFRMVRDGYAVPDVDRKDLQKTLAESKKAQRGQWSVDLLAVSNVTERCCRGLIQWGDEFTR